MSIVLSGIRIGIDDVEQEALEEARRLLRVGKNQILQIVPVKKSLDARRRDHISVVYSVQVDLADEEQKYAKAAAVRLGQNRVKYLDNQPVSFEKGKEKLQHPIVIAGFGPAGMFAALTLAENGYRPTILERGAEMDVRVAGVQAFWKQGILSPYANVQFGEGGAGTFSDGKLTTRISDHRCDYVLEKLTEFGAPKEILYQAKPHIGTDLLRDVVKNLRKRILLLGGDIRFETQVTDVMLKNGRLTGVSTNQGTIQTDNAVFAIGHSARDSFEMLFQKGVAMEAKPFSVGARIEHLQEDINKGLYGEYYNHPNLPVGEYQLSYRDGERGVYTFCMCPGGFVVPSCSEENTVVTNGMSEFSRNQKNANAALVVSVSPQDYGTHPLDGVRFQRLLERRAFELGGGDYSAPAQDAGSFMNETAGLRLGRVAPSYCLGVRATDFSQLYPDFIRKMMIDGLLQFDRKLPGFAARDAVLTGPETRTSSPIRMMRTETCESINLRGLYPCGEGAGYAGGIMSAAVDGMRVAEQIMKRYAPE